MRSRSRRHAAAPNIADRWRTPTAEAQVPSEGEQNPELEVRIEPVGVQAATPTRALPLTRRGCARPDDPWTLVTVGSPPDLPDSLSGALLREEWPLAAKGWPAPTVLVGRPLPETVDALAGIVAEWAVSGDSINHRLLALLIVHDLKPDRSARRQAAVCQPRLRALGGAVSDVLQIRATGWRGRTQRFANSTRKAVDRLQLLVDVDPRKEHSA